MTIDEVKIGSVFRMYDKFGTVDYEVVDVEENLYSYKIYLNAMGFENRRKKIFWPKLIKEQQLEYANGEIFEILN